MNQVNFILNIGGIHAVNIVSPSKKVISVIFFHNTNFGDVRSGVPGRSILA